MRPTLDLRHQLRTIDLTAIERHPPIVESSVGPSAEGLPLGGTPHSRSGAAASDASGRAALVWASEDDTRAFAARLATHPAIANVFIELRGELGAGKTTLVRHLLRALGVQGLIKSPTYAVLEPYDVAGLPIWHFDFYRFTDPREWEDAGFREVFAGPGLKLAEWPENAGTLLPSADLVVRIEPQVDESRHVALEARSSAGLELLG